MEKLREAEELWKTQQLEEFIHKCPAEIFIYGYPEEKLFYEYMTEEEKEKFIRRKEYTSDFEGLEMLGENEWNDFFEDIPFSRKCEFISDFQKIKMNVKNGIITPENLNSAFFNFYAGHRLTTGKPESSQRRIYLFGACNVLGLWCKDDQTIASYLQKLINREYGDAEVVNCGTWGSENIYGFWYSEPITSRDSVIIILTAFHNDLSLISKNMYCGNLESAVRETQNIGKCLFNNIAHHNSEFNRQIAKNICSDISETLSIIPQDELTEEIEKKDYFIPWHIHSYFQEYFQKYNLKKRSEDRIGAIVMKADPFTLGHRYLIEKALEKTEFLYVFVVQENKTYYPFEIRFDMVKEGTKDLRSLCVVPSGDYILSLFTFPDYFERTQIAEENSSDYDLQIFSDIVAPHLNISSRFVGSEPFDLVTRNYNEAMKKILPGKGITLVEIERLEGKNGIISASTFRKLADCGAYEQAFQLIPVATKKMMNTEFF